jgi:hypothetical protein
VLDAGASKESTADLIGAALANWEVNGVSQTFLSSCTGGHSGLRPCERYNSAEAGGIFGLRAGTGEVIEVRMNLRISPSWPYWSRARPR